MKRNIVFSRTIHETELKFRKNREFLWVSPEKRTIYLQEEPSCLLLYFPIYQEMMGYIRKMLQKEYTVGYWKVRR